MNHQARGLVYDTQRPITKYAVQGHGLRGVRLTFFRGTQEHMEHLPRFDPHRRLGSRGAAGLSHLALGDQRLQVAARELRQKNRQGPVQAFPVLIGTHLNPPHLGRTQIRGIGLPMIGIYDR